MVKDDRIIELQPNIFRLKGEDTSSHSYLIRGDYKNVLIDSGVDKNFSKLQKSLLTLGLKIRDIDIVINTHEHFDHIGANRYFQDYALISAHRFAATKITVEDRYVTMYKSGDLNAPSLKVHLWLESKSRFNLGNYSLNIIHTPGHTSGSICIYEPVRKILFAGDTVFAGGTLSYIGESGSVGDYIDSISHLATRKINELYPGHGKVSKSPEEDMQKAILNARALLRDDEEVVSDIQNLQDFYKRTKLLRARIKKKDLERSKIEQALLVLIPHIKNANNKNVILHTLSKGSVKNNLAFLHPDFTISLTDLQSQKSSK